MTGINLDATADAYDFKVMVNTCTNTGVTVNATTAAGTAMSELRVYWAINAEPLIHFDTTSLAGGALGSAATGNTQLITVNYPWAALASTSGVICAYYLLGYSATKGSNNKMGVLLSAGGQSIGTTSLSFQIDPTKQGADSHMLRVDFSYIICQKDLMTNNSATTKLYYLDSDFDYESGDINSNTQNRTKSYSVGNRYLPNNLFPGFRGIINDIGIRFFSLYLSFKQVSGSQLQYEAYSNSALAQKIRGFAGYIFIFHGYDCISTGTFLKADRSDCVAACPNNQYASAGCNYCWPCDSTCFTCNEYLSTNCLSCNGARSLYLSTCVLNCPSNYYSSANVCYICPSVCLTCTSTTNCLTCVNPNALLNGACLAACPNDYFVSTTPSTLVCLACKSRCIRVVALEIRPLYPALSPVTQLEVIIELNFPINNIDAFFQINVPFPANIVKIPSSNQTYFRYIITPINQIVYKKEVTAITVPKTPAITGASGQPVLDTSFSLSVKYTYTFLNTSSTGPLSAALAVPADWIRNLSDQVPPQVKMLFSFGMPSLQLTSSLMLSGKPLPKLLYDGLSIISHGNIYTIPPWQQLPGNRSMLGITNIKDQNQSRLLADLQVPNSLFRTNISSYFIYNIYIQISILLFSILFNLLLQLLYAKRIASSGWSAIAWAFCDYCHQILVMYLFIGLMVELQSYQTLGPVSIVSLSLSIFILIQFICYCLFRFYDFNNLSKLTFQDDQFTELSRKFGHYLKNIRISDAQYPYLVQPFLHPKYYHFIANIKKAMMMMAIAVFADNFWVQLGTLASLQGLETIRFIWLMPYIKPWRNYTRLIVQLLIFLTMISILVCGYFFEDIQVNGTSSADIYNKVGLFGVICCYIFNVYYLSMMIYDMFRRFFMSDRQMFQSNLKEHCYNQIVNSGHQIQLAKIKKYVLMGNLNQRAERTELPEIDVRVQMVQIFKKGNGFSLRIDKCLLLEMSDYLSQDINCRVVQRKKLNKSIKSQQIDDQQIVQKVLDLLGNNQIFRMKSFSRVQQSKYKNNASIPMNLQFQEMETIREGRNRLVKLQGENINRLFPLTLQSLRSLNLIS